MSIELKIKSKHLSLESKVIRFEERKLAKQLSWLNRNEKPTIEVCWKISSLSDHRKNIVGRENRATFLARAFIAGHPYTRAEKIRKDSKHYEFNALVLPRVLEMVKKYHPDYKVRREITLDNIMDWCML